MIMNRFINNKRDLMINYGYGMIMNNYIAFPIHIFNQLYVLKKLINAPSKLNTKGNVSVAVLTLEKDEINFFKKFFNVKTQLTKKDIVRMIEILIKYGMKCESKIVYSTYKRVPTKYFYTLYTGCKFVKRIYCGSGGDYDSKYRFNSYSVVNFFNKLNNEPLYSMRNIEVDNADKMRINTIVNRRDYFLGVDVGLNIKNNILNLFLDIHKYMFFDTILFVLIKFLKTHVLNYFILKLNKHLSFRGRNDSEFHNILKKAISGTIVLNNLVIEAANDTFKSPVFRMNYKEIIAVKNYSNNKLNKYFTECLIDRLKDDLFLEQILKN